MQRNAMRIGVSRPVASSRVSYSARQSHLENIRSNHSADFSRQGMVSLRNAVISRPLAAPARATIAASTQGPKSNLPQLDSILPKFLSWVAKGVAVLAVASALALGTGGPAHAARSGGRIGGSAFSGRSFVSPYGTSSSRSNSVGADFGRSFPVGTFPHRHGSSVTTNAFFFSPWGFGMGYGYGYPMGGGGGLGSLLFWGVFAVIAFQALRGVMDQSDGALPDSSKGGERLSVAKVQVGLLASARDLQRDLERIASRADTSSSRGLHYVLQETVLALMRNPDYCVYGFAKSGVERSGDDAESRFNKLSLEERGKFQKETRVNVAGRTSTGSLGTGVSSSAPISELIVVTIIVAAEGRLRVPKKVTSRTELNEALTTLGSVPAEDVLAVEVLWTPEEEGDYFTQQDLALDYPLLNTL